MTPHAESVKECRFFVSTPQQNLMSTPQQNVSRPVFKTAAFSLVLLTMVLIGVKFYANNKAAKELDAAIAGLSLFAKVTYADVDFALLSQRLTISKVTVSPGGLAALDKKGQNTSVKIRSILIDDALNLGARRIGFAVKGVELDPAMFEAESAMKELGIKAPLLLDVGINLGIDVQEKELNLKSFSLRVQDLAALSMGLKLGNLGLTEEMIDKIKNNPSDAMGMFVALTTATLSSAEFSYTDESLAEKLMTKAAKEEKESIEKFKGGLIEKVKASGRESEDEFVKGLVKPLSDFIATPRKISLKAAPKKPVPFGALMGLDSPETVIKTLGIRVE